MIFSRKKNLVVDLFTYSIGAFESAKPAPAIKFAPDWWKKCPASIKRPDEFWPMPTIKQCPAFLHLYARGLIFPLWSDLAIELGDKNENQYRWQFADEISKVDWHSFDQLDNYLDPKEYSHLKLISPWAIRTKENIEWTWTQPEWNHLKNYDYKVAPGLRNFKTTHYTNVNMFFKKEEGRKNILIKHLEPLAHLVPLMSSDRKLKLNYHLITEEEFKALNTYSTSFFRPTSFCIKQREKR